MSQWKAGIVTFQRYGNTDRGCWTACINQVGWFQCIEVHRSTEEEATQVRDFILQSLQAAEMCGVTYE
jgi:hypothetical protein